MSRRSAVRGRVWKRGRTWFYEVSDGKKVVLTDNTGTFAPMIAACSRDVAAVRRVIGAGHRFRFSYAELVDRAS